MVMVTLQVPAFRVFTPDPDTLHTFAYADAIFRAYLPPEGTVVFASFNRVVFDAVAPCLTTFDAVDDAPVFVAGAAVVLDDGGTVDDVEVDVVDDAMVVELEDELDDWDAAARVTATVYAVVPVPESAAAVKVMFSVAPTATDSVSVSEESAIVPVELVRLMAAPDEDARTVKSTVDDAFGIDSV